MCPPEYITNFLRVLYDGCWTTSFYFPKFSVSTQINFKNHHLLFPHLFIYWIIELCYFWHNKIPLFYLIRTQSAQNLTPLISPCPYIYPIGSNFCHLLIRKFPGSNSSYHPIRLKIYILVGTHYWMETGRKPVSGFVHVWLFCSFEFFGFYAPKKIPRVHTFWKNEFRSFWKLWNWKPCVSRFRVLGTNTFTANFVKLPKRLPMYFRHSTPRKQEIFFQ
jgi:hypothetical protein